MTLTLIEGGDNPVLKHKLITDPDTGKPMMRCELGPYSASLVLPDYLAGASKERLQTFFDIAVAEMTKTLVATRLEHQSKIRKKAKKCSSNAKF